MRITRRLRYFMYRKLKEIRRLCYFIRSKPQIYILLFVFVIRWPNYKEMMPKSLNSVFVLVERFFLIFSSKCASDLYFYSLVKKSRFPFNIVYQKDLV